MDSGRIKTDEELKELYEHRYDGGFPIIYYYLSQADKERYEELKPEEKVKKWREEGTLLDKMLTFSNEEKEMYFPYIELDEGHEVLVRRWIIDRIICLKICPAKKQQVKDQISKITPEQREIARAFLKRELQKASNNYKKEIETLIAMLDEIKE